jgi:hypothetical protein
MPAPLRALLSAIKSGAALAAGRVTFDIPLLNIAGPKEIPELNEIITAIDRF